MCQKMDQCQASDSCETESDVFTGVFSHCFGPGKIGFDALISSEVIIVVSRSSGDLKTVTRRKWKGWGVPRCSPGTYSANVSLIPAVHIRWVRLVFGKNNRCADTRVVNRHSHNDINNEYLYPSPLYSRLMPLGWYMVIKEVMETQQFLFSGYTLIKTYLWIGLLPPISATFNKWIPLKPHNGPLRCMLLCVSVACPRFLLLSL